MDTVSDHHAARLVFHRVSALIADSALEDRQVQASHTAPISAIPVRTPCPAGKGCDWPGGPAVAGKVEAAVYRPLVKVA